MQNSCLKTSAWWSRGSHFVENGYLLLRFPNMVKVNIYIHKHRTPVTRFNPWWVSGYSQHRRWKKKASSVLLLAIFGLHWKDALLDIRRGWGGGGVGVPNAHSGSCALSAEMRSLYIKCLRFNQEERKGKCASVTRGTLWWWGFVLHA